MSHLRITLLFDSEDNTWEMAWLRSAYDEVGEEAWGGTPAWYLDQREEADHPRELVLLVPADAVRRLYEPDEIIGTAVS